MKLIRLDSDTQANTESERAFVVRTTRVEQSSYTPVAGESDVTDLYTLRIMLKARAMDFKAYRSGLQHLDSVGGNDAETNTEIARRFAAANPVDVVTEFPNVWDRVWNGFEDFHIPSVETRTRRFQWCSALLYNALPLAVADAIIDRITLPTATEGSLIDNYVHFGREGIIAGDLKEGISDYIASHTGTTFVTNGLLEDITSTNGELTDAQIVDYVDNCINKGIYYRP